jgi:hypothetical protein
MAICKLLGQLAMHAASVNLLSTVFALRHTAAISGWYTLLPSTLQAIQ